jgi:hypothetical protein
MPDKTVGAQVKRGFQRAGLVLLIFGWLFLVFAGVGEGFAPGGGHRPVVGLAILTLATVVFFWTMDRWIKVFPGLLALATLNAAAAIFTGHATGNPSVVVAPTHAGIAAGLLADSTLRLGKPTYKLRMLDRVAVFGFVFCIFWTAVDERAQIVAPAVACGLLVLAWVYDRFRGLNPNHHSSLALGGFSRSKVK